VKGGAGFKLPASTVNGMGSDREKNQMLGRKSIQQSFESNVQFATKAMCKILGQRGQQHATSANHHATKRLR
jgi:hypothetical protein